MSLVREVARNTFWQAGGKGVGTLLGLGSSLVLFRYLHDAGYGTYITVMVYLQIFATVVDLGLYIVLVKRLATSQNPSELLSHVFSFRLVTGLLGFLLAFLLMYLIPSYSTVIRYGILIMSFNFLGITLSQVLTAVFQKFQALQWVAYAEISSKVFLFFSTLAVAYVLHLGIFAVFAIVAITGMANFFILFFRAQKFIPFRLRFDRAEWASLLRESWPVALAILFNLLYFKADTFLLGIFRTQDEVGIYGAPYKVLEVLVTLPAMFVGLILPPLSESFQKKDHVRFQKIFQRSFDTLAAMAFPLALGGFIVAKPLMLLIAGANFTDQPEVLGELFRVLAWAVAIIFFGTLTGYAVVVVGKQVNMLKGYAWVGVSSLIFYFIFIPRYSYWGAAGVTLYSEIAIVLFGLYYIFQATRFFPSFRNFFKALASALMMAFVLWFFREQSVFFLIPFGAVLYAGLVYLFGIFTRNDIQEILRFRK